MLKILHFADLHIGSPFRRFGGKGKELREGAKKTLTNIVRLAREENVDLVISAGDIADSNRLAPATVNFIVDELNKLEVPLVILAGNHDCLDQGSLYRRQQWSRLRHWYLFDQEHATFTFPDLSLAVHGRPNTARTSPASPLQGLTPAADMKWNLAAAHGSLQIEGKSAPDDHPLTFDEIGASQMDYIALGHWHNFYQFSHQGVTACYAGAASTASFAHEDSGTVNIVEFSAAGVEIRRAPVSHYRWRQAACSPRDLPAVLDEHAHPQTLLHVKLTAGAEAGDAETIDRQAADYQGRYYWLGIDYDEHHEWGSREIEIDRQGYPETTFLGQFLKITQEKIDAADGGEKAFLEKALAEGYRISLTGEVD